MNISTPEDFKHIIIEQFKDPVSACRMLMLANKANNKNGDIGRFYPYRYFASKEFNLCFLVETHDGGSSVYFDVSFMPLHTAHDMTWIERSGTGETYNIENFEINPDTIVFKLTTFVLGTTDYKFWSHPLVSSTVLNNPLVYSLGTRTFDAKPANWLSDMNQLRKQNLGNYIDLEIHKEHIHHILKYATMYGYDKIPEVVYAAYDYPGKDVVSKHSHMEDFIFALSRDCTRDTKGTFIFNR